VGIVSAKTGTGIKNKKYGTGIKTCGTGIKTKRYGTGIKTRTIRYRYQNKNAVPVLKTKDTLPVPIPGSKPVPGSKQCYNT
jgi:hypothetical protein